MFRSFFTITVVKDWLSIIYLLFYDRNLSRRKNIVYKIGSLNVVPYLASGLNTVLNFKRLHFVTIV